MTHNSGLFDLFESAHHYNPRRRLQRQACDVTDSIFSSAADDDDRQTIQLLASCIVRLSIRLSASLFVTLCLSLFRSA